MNNYANIIVEVPFYYESKNQIQFEGIASYYINNDVLIYESAKITRMFLRPRNPRNKNNDSKAIYNLRQKNKDLQIRFEILKDDEKINDSNKKLCFLLEYEKINIEILKNELKNQKVNNLKFNKINIDLDCKIVENSNELLDKFNNAFNSTVNSLYFYILGVNPSGKNKSKNSQYKIKSSNSTINNKQFIQFFTYVVGQVKRSQQKPINTNDYIKINFDEFYEKYMNVYYKLVFNATNKIEIDNNILSNKFCEKLNNEIINKNPTWEKINQIIVNELRNNLEINPHEEINLNNYIDAKKVEYNKNIFKLIEKNKYFFDSIYSTYLTKYGYVQFCHIWEQNQIKKEYIKTQDIDVLNNISNESNVLFLTPSIHFLWDKKWIKLNHKGFFENLNLSKKEWEHLGIENINVFEKTKEIQEKQKEYLRLRNIQ